MTSNGANGDGPSSTETSWPSVLWAIFRVGLLVLSVWFLRDEIASVKTDLRSEIASTKSEVSNAKTELRNEIASVKTELNALDAKVGALSERMANVEGQLKILAGKS